MTTNRVSDGRGRGGDQTAPAPLPHIGWSRENSTHFDMQIMAAIDPDLEISVVEQSDPAFEQHMRERVEAWAILAGANRTLAYEVLYDTYGDRFTSRATGQVALSESTIHLDAGEQTQVRVTASNPEDRLESFAIRVRNRETGEEVITDPIEYGTAIYFGMR